MKTFATRPLPQLRRSAGVGLVTAIFLLVVLASLAIAIVSLSSAQQVSSALDTQGTLAYQAARAGGEIGTYRVLRGGGTCLASDNIALPAGTSLGAFTVTVTCVKSTPAAGLERYLVRATACSEPAAGACPNPNPGADYVQRVVEVRL